MLGTKVDPANISGEGLAPQRRSSTALLAGLILCAVLPYLNTLVNGFVYDDNNEVLNNPYLRSFGHLKEIFSTGILAHLGARGVTNYYRPVSTFGFLLCYQLFGPLPYGFHLANVVLNAAIVCLLFILTRRMFQNSGLAFGTAVLFALHPAHSEAVAWVSAVTDLEVTFFFLLTFWFFLEVVRPGGGRLDWPQVGMAAGFVLSLLSKEQAVVIPLLATVYEHFYRDDRRETSWRQKAARYYSLWLLLVAYLIFRVRFFGGLTAVLLTPRVTWYEAVLSAFALAGQYVWKFLWPAHLTAYYAFQKSVTPLDPRVLAGVVALVACAVLFVLLWKHAHLVSFGLIWFFATLALVLNARWIGPNVFNERYLYLPSIGLCWVAAWGGFEAWAWSSHRPAAARKAVAGVLGLLAILAVARIVTRNRDWQNEVTYYRTTLAGEPLAVGLHINLGAAYWNGGNAEAAEAEWRVAEKLAPDNAMVLNNLGLVYARKNNDAKAIECFERSMRERPVYTDPHLNLGRLYAERGINGPAELQLRAAVALAPLNIQARNRLGQFYFENGRLPEAEVQFRNSVESEATPAAWDYLGDIYTRWGRREEAEQAFRRAVALDEFDSHAHFGLAALYAAVRNIAEARKEYEAGLRTDPANPQARAALEKLRSHESPAKP